MRTSFIRIKTDFIETVRKKLTSFLGLDHRHKVLNDNHELADVLRQEAVDRNNGLVSMLRQESMDRNNELASILRREDEQWADMLRKEVELLIKDIHQIENDAASNLMHTRLLFAKEKWKNLSQAELLPTLLKEIEEFSKYLERFKNLHPHLYDVWATINFGVNIDEYKDRPISSCSVDGRFNAQLFAGFAAPYLQGRILDIGCGPYAVPSYLEGYPVSCISGIDPLEPFETHPFEFVHGFAEFLPWQDDSFDVVIAATSLDHVLSLDLALSEIRRVLKPGGLLLIWDWFGDEYKPYDPENQSPRLLDRFHLFNFNEKWFEELMGDHFIIIEKAHYSGEWRHDYHYCLKLKAEQNK